jgi:hypothetical protein
MKNSDRKMAFYDEDIAFLTESQEMESRAA